MKPILKNTLLEWMAPVGASRIERIVYLHSGGKHLQTISIEPAETVPRVIVRKDLLEALELGTCKILEKDPWYAGEGAGVRVGEKAVCSRDARWKKIELLVEQPPDVIFDPQKRGQVVRQIVATGVNRTLVYRYFGAFLRGGQVKDALLPHAGRGKAKKLAQIRGPKPRMREPGITIGPKEVEIFGHAIRHHYLGDAKRSLRDTYLQLLATHYNIGYKLEKGTKVPVLKALHLCPSYRQFEYWFSKNQNLADTLLARESARKFNLKHRAKEGRSIAFSPGSLYQIDSTIADIYLVSARNRQILVGRPTLYFVVDVFSRMVVGFHVGFEHASYNLASLAIAQAACDKVRYCERNGIPIKPGDWPSFGLPEAIVADRGELKGIMADQIPSSLGIRIENTPPYRADLKGQVESTFHAGNQSIIRWLPGGSYGTRERGDKDPKKSANLTLYEFRQALIHWVLMYNSRRLLDYPANEFQLDAGVNHIPVDLWDWGLSQRGGSLKQVAEDSLRLRLLPNQEASVRAGGIYFRGLEYNCETLVKQDWKVKARNEGSWKVKIALDPEDVGLIYLRHQNQTLEPCELLDHCRAYAGLSWEEVTALRQLQNNPERTLEDRQRRVDLQSHVEAIAAQGAKAAKDSALSGGTKKVQTKDLKENARTEAAAERAAGKSRLNAPGTPIPPASAPSTPPATAAGSDDYVPAPSWNALIRSKS